MDSQALNIPGTILALNPGFPFRILSRFGEKAVRQNPDGKPGFEASTMLGCPKEGETMDPRLLPLGRLQDATVTIDCSE